MEVKSLVFLIACGLLFGAGACVDGNIGSSRSAENQTNTIRNLPTDTAVKGLSRIADSPPIDGGARRSLQCTDEQRCWLSGPRELWRSTDGGRGWEKIYISSEDEGPLSSYLFKDGQGWRLSYNNRLYETEDGGTVWIQLKSPFLEHDGDLRSLEFANGGRIGWLAGGVYRPQTSEELRSGVPNNARDTSGDRVLEEAIFRTNDSSRSWERQALPLKLIGRILEIKFVNESQGVALGEHGLYYTSNGGDSWRPVTFKNDCVRKEYLSDFYEASPDNLAMLDSKVSLLSYTDGRLIKTDDGGHTWCDLIQPRTVAFEDGSGKPQYFVKMHFDSSTHGWGLGWDRFLYETIDGGLKWSRVTSDIRFFDMTFSSRASGLLLGESGVYRLVW